MIPLEEIAARHGDVKSVAVVTSARANQLELLARKLRETFPGAGLAAITQKGRAAEIARAMPGAVVYEALPPGVFKLGGILNVDFAKAKSAKPDLLILAYNNHYGEGYWRLKIAASLIAPGKIIGAFCDIACDGKTSCENVSISRLAAIVLGRVLLAPVELILVAGVLVAYFVMLGWRSIKMRSSRRASMPGSGGAS